MNLLNEGINKKLVELTKQNVKLTVDGITDTYPVYRIPLNLLYYNDQNDRIATWISQYKAENKVDSVNREDIELYNSIIHRFIYESNPDKLKDTQKNIELIGQQKYGIVLNDGRIIDGNRRFTCLRNLSKEKQGFGYFEAIILDKNIENNAKQIKMLELQIQIGEDAKVDYNPIDRLAGIYKDIVEEKLLTVHEYAQSINAKSDKEVEKLVEISQLLVEFLEAINAPKQFYIARDKDLNGPLYELHAILKNIKDDEQKEEVKYAVFTNFLMEPDKDMTRFVRSLKAIAKDKDRKYLDEFLEKEMEIVETVLSDDLLNSGKVTSETIAKVSSNDVIKDQLKRTMETVSNKVKVKEIRNMPAQILEKAKGGMEEIDTNIFKKLNEEQLSEIDNLLDDIEVLIDKLRGELY